MLIAVGVVLVLAGVLWDVLGRTGFFGRLPGDILIRKKNFTFYFPLATSILLSAVLSALLWIFSRRSG
jgi:hypothetical protein